MQDRVLAGRYRLIDQLGQGGMGSVWRAQDSTLHTQVAIKLIDPAIAESSEILERFQREALAAAELRSTHIVQVLDYGVDEGCPFIAMELLEGESLADRLDRVGALTLDDTSKILSQVARALGRAHDKGIVHRDLKPDNIFIVTEGDEEVTKVLDFGIAKKLDALSVSCSTKTRTGALLGTPYYMSPEQALGRKSIDHRTDIWSLAVIAYECLTGIRPFDNESVGALLMSICHEPIPTPSHVAAVNPEFDSWFAKAAAREPDDRFQSAFDAASALRAIGRANASQNLGQDTILTTLNNSKPGRDVSIALLETLGTAAVTIPSRTRQSAIRRRAVSLWLGFGVASVLGLLVWYKFANNSTPIAAATPAASHAGGQIVLAPSTASPPSATTTGAPSAVTQLATQSPAAESARQPTSKANAPAVPPAKPARRASTRRHDNPAGF